MEWTTTWRMADLEAAPLFTADEAATFDLPSSTRATLSAILIVHPIAAFFTLVMLICAASAHMHSPSHSTRYLCVVFILSIVTLLLSLLAFLIDVLLFVPHMAWGSYLVLVAVILIAISGVVLCAMRRTLVGRKARKKRIEGNAEMSGENYYARNGPAAASVPMTGTMIEEKPSFTTVSNTETNEESRPLTEQSPADMSPVAMSGANGEPSGHSVAGFATMPPRVPSNPRDRDQSAPPALGRPMYDAGMGMGARGRGGSRGRGWGGYGPPPPGPYRGGFGMRGRGNYGPPPGRGGFGPPPRGQYGPMCAGSDGRGGFGPPAGYMGPPRINNGMMAATGPGREGSAPPTYRKPLPLAAPPNEGPVYDAFGQVIPAYQRQRSPATGYVAYQAPPDEARSTMPTAESPPPLPAELEPARITPQTAMIGQAVEMDAATGSPSHPPQEYRPYQPGSDRDPHGFVEDSEQQHRGASYGSSGNNPSGGEE